MGGWNRGLTKETDERVARNAAAISVALRGRIPYNAIAATRGKTFEEIHGVEGAKILRRMLSFSLKGNRNALGTHKHIKKERKQIKWYGKLRLFFRSLFRRNLNGIL